MEPMVQAHVSADDFATLLANVGLSPNRQRSAIYMAQHERKRRRSHSPAQSFRGSYASRGSPLTPSQQQGKQQLMLMPHQQTEQPMPHLTPFPMPPETEGSAECRPQADPTAGAPQTGGFSRPGLLPGSVPYSRPAGDDASTEERQPGVWPQSNAAQCETSKLHARLTHVRVISGVRPSDTAATAIPSPAPQDSVGLNNNRNIAAQHHAAEFIRHIAMAPDASPQSQGAERALVARADKRHLNAYDRIDLANPHGVVTDQLTLVG